MSLANLAAALVKAQGDAQAVAKASTNSFHRYKYASAESLIEEGRGALSGAGLALLTTRWEILAPVSEACSGLMKVYYLLLHSSGEQIALDAVTSIIPEKGRPQDKAEATALTYNLGYFIRGLLLLPREDESQAVDARDDRERGERRPPQERPQPSPGPGPAKAPSAPPRGAGDGFNASFITGIEGALDAIEAATNADELIAIRNRLTELKLPTEQMNRVRAPWTAKKDSFTTKAA